MTKQYADILNAQLFWHKLKTASQRFLGLDYDGTLAPFHPDRMKAFPVPGIKEILNEISKQNNSTLAVISGRSLTEVTQLLSNLNIYFIGSHGNELLFPDGKIEVNQPDALQQEGLELAKTSCVHLGYDKQTETKLGCIAFHTRGISGDIAKKMESQVREKWESIANLHNLECFAFDGGIEIRSLGRNKGDILEKLLSLHPSENDRLVVYIGDDKTDEDAFQVLRKSGIGIKVGKPSNRTYAQNFLPDCKAVKKFLELWLKCTATKSTGKKIP